MNTPEMNNEVAKELEEKLGRHVLCENIGRLIEEYIKGRMLLHLGKKLDEELKDICFDDLGSEEVKSDYINMKNSAASISLYMVFIEKFLKDIYKIDIKALFDERKTIERFDADGEARHNGKA